MAKMFRKLIVAVLVVCITMSCFTTLALGDITDPNLMGSLSVTGLHSGATVRFRHIIRHNPEKVTGWEFYPAFTNSDWKYSSSTLRAFATAYGVESELLAKYGLTASSTYSANKDAFIAYEQDVLKEVIKDYSGRVNDNNSSDASSAAMNGSSQFVSALENVISYGIASNSKTANGSGNASLATDFKNNSHIGVYVIHPQDVAGTYIYNPSAAFVMFDYQVTGGTETIYSIPNVVAKAKGILNVVNKTSTDKSLAIGDTATYTVTSTYPTFAEQYKKTAIYTISDTSTQLQNYNVTSVTLDGVTLTKGTDYTVNSITNGIEIKLLDGAGTLSDYDSANGGKEVVVNYTATVKALDTDGTVKNTARVTTQPESSQDAWITESIHVADSYKVHITKENEYGHTLSGAEFVAKNSAGKYVTFTYDSANLTYTVSGTSETLTDTCKIVFNSRMGVTLAGLDADETYTLTETLAPDGYQILDETIVLGTSNTALGLTVTTEETQYITDGTGIYTSKKESTIDTTGDDIFNIDYVNTKLFALPETGWWGTYIFTLVGVALIVTAVIIHRHRKKAEA